MNAAALPSRPRDWQMRWSQLVRSMARVQTPRGEEQLLDWLLRPGEARVLAFVDTRAMNLAAESDPFYHALTSADVVVRDGLGVSLLMHLCNQAPGQDLRGADLVPKVLARANGLPLALFGSREPWLSRAREAVAGRLAPDSACVVADGSLDLQDYIRIAARHRPRVIVLGMGMPRQEQVALALRAALGTPCLIVCGGAVLDVLGRKLPRAPRWARSLGLAWAFRLGPAPRRSWLRHARGHPLFLRRAVAMTLRPPRSGSPQPA